MIKFGTGLINIELDWPSFKAIAVSKFLKIQHVLDEQNLLYQIFGIDGTIVYSTTIFSQLIPSVCDTNQITNDAYKADFETNFVGNQSKI